MPTTTFVVTHPEATHHAEGRVGGWYDAGLTDRGRRDAERIAERIQALISGSNRVAVYSSDLTRAIQTADPIARLVGVDVTPMRELRERSYGSAEGRPREWLRERRTPVGSDENALDSREGIPGAETRREWMDRIRASLAEIEHSAAAARVVVTHGGTKNGFIALWLGLPFERAAFTGFHAPSGSISVLTADDNGDRWISRLGDSDHLPREPQHRS